MSLFNSEDVSINNVISSGSSVAGNIKINGYIHIDGDLEGNLECSGNVTIGQDARIRGNISAKSMTIGGIVCGNLHAQNAIHLLSTSAVIGDIQARKLQADENVIIHGHCICISEENSYNEALSNWQNTQAVTSKIVKV
ncbi:MAG: polymer-forming cytoskeletal protein [Treponema sp.]|nr:polymer-forming cytoskeletal protein [Treponema sp.]